MALRAIRAHLPLVNVRVALFTILAHICEHRLEVALRALNFLVHLAQRIAGLVVIEFRNRTNGAPARSGLWQFSQGMASGPCGLRVVTRCGAGTGALAARP